MLVLMAVCCPSYQTDHLITGGTTDTGKPRDRCLSPDCPRRSCVLDPAYKGRLPEIKQQAIALRGNGRGIRDTARVSQSSLTTVMKELKKKGLRSQRPSPASCTP